MQNRFPMCCWKLSPTERVYLAWHETQANFLLVNQGKKSFVEYLRSIRLSILPSMALCGNKSLPSQGYIDLMTQRARDCVVWLVTQRAGGCFISFVTQRAGNCFLCLVTQRAKDSVIWLVTQRAKYSVIWLVTLRAKDSVIWLVTQRAKYSVIWLVTQRTRDCVLWLVTGCAQKRCFTGASTDSRETGDYEGREANCSLPLSRIQRKSLTTTLWGDQMKEILWTNYCSSSGTSLRLKAHYHLKPNQQKAKEKQKRNK